MYALIGIDRRVEARQLDSKSLKRTTCIVFEVIEKTEDCIVYCYFSD